MRIFSAFSIKINVTLSSNPEKQEFHERRDSISNVTHKIDIARYIEWNSYILRKPVRGVECRSSRVIPRLRSA